MHIVQVKMQLDGDFFLAAKGRSASAQKCHHRIESDRENPDLGNMPIEWDSISVLLFF